MFKGTKNKLGYLVDCRDKEEAMERLKALGIEISESELEEIKQSLNENSGHSSCLGMEQLEKVAGGTKRFRQNEGKEKNENEHHPAGGVFPQPGVAGTGVPEAAVVPVEQRREVAGTGEAPQPGVAGTGEAPQPGVAGTGVPEAAVVPVEQRREVDETGKAPKAPQSEVVQHITAAERHSITEEQLRDVAVILEGEGHHETAEMLYSVATWILEREENQTNTTDQYENVAQKLMYIAREIKEKGHDEEAAKVHLVAARLFVGAGNLEDAEFEYSVAANLFGRARKFTTAAEVHSYSVMICVDAENFGSAAWECMDAADCFTVAAAQADPLEREEYHLTAADLYITASELFKQERKFEPAVEALLKAAQQFKLSGRCEDAVELFELAAELSEQADEPADAANQYILGAELSSNLAIQFANKGNYKAAVEQYKFAIRLHKEAVDQFNQAEEYIFADQLIPTIVNQYITIAQLIRTIADQSRLEEYALGYSYSLAADYLSDAANYLGAAAGNLEEKAAVLRVTEGHPTFFATTQLHITVERLRRMKVELYRIAAQWNKEDAELLKQAKKRKAAAFRYSLAAKILLYELGDCGAAAELFKIAGQQFGLAKDREAAAERHQKASELFKRIGKIKDAEDQKIKACRLLQYSCYAKSQAEI